MEGSVAFRENKTRRTRRKRDEREDRLGLGRWERSCREGMT